VGVVTVRTYWKHAEAALAKSLLDDYEIVSALVHENASLCGYSGMAMPIRLMVVEEQAERAKRILQGDFEGAAALEESALQPADELRDKARRDRPWELLILAFYFFLPGVCVLLVKYPARFSKTSLGRYLIAKLAIFHMFGWLAVAFAILLVVLFWYAQRSPMTESSGEAKSVAQD
jgi:hypothetical protein